MASSGQRANWSLGYLGQALFSLRERRDFARVLTVFVEEPELHLHPDAQVKMSQILAVLVNAGFRVVATTHSLNIVYAINNLLLARKRFQTAKGEGLPDPAMRLEVEDVAAWDFTDGVPRDVMDRNKAFIEEHELGEVGASQGEEMNALLNREARE
jgi:ABC-type multidrug transport system ATPase subunit